MNIKNNSLLDLRSTSACLLALAVKELFPRAVMLGGKATTMGFYCDFLFPFPFESALLRQIEEGMFAFIRKKEEVSLREMVPFSAKGYFRSEGEWFLADMLEQSALPTIDMMNIAGRMFLTDGSACLNHLGEIKALRLHKGEVLEGLNLKNGVRIHGTAFFDKGELKEFLREQGDWIGVSHVLLGKEKGFFKEVEAGRCFWLPKGMKIKALLMEKIQEAIEERGMLSVSTLPVLEGFSFKDFFKRHQKLFESDPKSFEGKFFSECATVCASEAKISSIDLLNGSVFQANFSHLFCKENLLLEEVISCLHFMTKIFKILDLEFQIVLVESEARGRSSKNSMVLLEALKLFGSEFIEMSDGSGDSKVEWRVKDRLGAEWPVSCVYAPQKVKNKGGVRGNEIFCLPQSLFLSFERIIALVIERSKGKLPLWLSPCQIKTMPLQKSHEECVDKTSLESKE